MERIGIERVRRSDRLSGRRTRSLYGGLLAASFTLSMLICLPALAATSLNFVTSDGQFSIDNDRLIFTNGFTIPPETVDSISDSALLGARVTIDPITLTGEIMPIDGGFVLARIVPEPLALTIRQATDAGGALLATATFVPGDLLILEQSSGEISSEIAAGQSDFILEQAGESSSVLSSFAATADPIAIELSFSAASQDIAALIEADSPVMGSSAGSMAIVVPEPAATALTGAAMATLLLVTGLRRRGRDAPTRQD